MYSVYELHRASCTGRFGGISGAKKLPETTLFATSGNKPLLEKTEPV